MEETPAILRLRGAFGGCRALIGGGIAGVKTS